LRKTVLIVSIAVVAVSLGLALHTQRQATPVPVAAVDTPVDNAVDTPRTIDFELTGLDGKPRSFSEWGGQHRIVNFWATWCAPCRREIPLLKAFQEQHGADGFQVIGVAVEFLEPVIAYAADADFNYPILVGEQDAMAVAESSGVGFVGLPFTMIVTRDGTLIGAHMGEIHQQQLDEIVAVLGKLDRGELDAAAARTALNLM